jgi:basic membrane lipoprotein Med (substrate-binding protein (PBP1-ABC) superfamily)
MLIPRVRDVCSRPHRRAARAVVRAAGLLLSVTIALAAAACGDSPSEPGSRASGGQRLKVALLVPGLTNDGSWNQFAREAVEKLKNDGRIDVAIKEKMADPAAAEPVIREYATTGYDLVIGHGALVAEPMLKVSKDFPKVKFLITGGPDALQKVSANVEAWTYDFAQQGFLLGWIAGKIKDVQTVGLVGGLQIPPIQAIHAGFKSGLKDAAPSRTWKEAYTGNFDDAQKALEAATGLIDQGAQIVFTSGDGIGNGVASAADRHQPKALTLGVTGDAGGLAKKVNITNVELDMLPTYQLVVERAAAGTFGNKGYTSTLANKGLVPTPISKGASDPRIPPDLQEQVNKLIADFASGAKQLPPQ